MDAQLFSTTDNPIPSRAVAAMIQTGSGVNLRTARWASIGNRKLGTVCVFPGRSEPIEKYFETVTNLRRRGFHVAILDWRGQGCSDRALKDPRKGHVDSFGQYLEDVEAFMQHIIMPDCPPPYFGLAHSMGGLILLHAIARNAAPLERLVLSAPLIGLPVSGIAESLMSFATYIYDLAGLSDRFIPGYGASSPDSDPFDRNTLTSDRKRYERNGQIVAQHPQVAIGAPTMGWLLAALQAMRRLHETEFANGIRIPILAVNAAADQIVAPKAAEQLISDFRSANVITIKGAQHELLQERDIIREQFWAAFDAFIPGSTDDVELIGR